MKLETNKSGYIFPTKSKKNQINYDGIEKYLIQILFNKKSIYKILGERR